jgi:uncharacterized protein YjdB
VTDDGSGSELLASNAPGEGDASSLQKEKTLSVQATPPPSYVAPGDKVQLKALISGASLAASDRAVKWSIRSYGGTSAKIDAATGLFTAGGKEGVVTVRVASGASPSVYDELTVTVAKPVTKVVLPVKKLYLKKGASFAASACAYSPQSASAKLTWTSSNPKVAPVNSVSGKVNALTKGTAVITARSLNGMSAKFTVNVVSKTKKVKKIKLGGYKKTMKRGRTAQLKITVSPADATLSKISLKSSRPSVLTIDKAGKLTAKKKGSATITVTAGNTSQKIKINVK